MLSRLKRLVDAVVGPGEFRECRRCGTAVDPAPSACPACGSREIAGYEL